MTTRYKTTAVAIALASLLAITGCASPLRHAENLAAREEWSQAVNEYRKLYAQHPGDVEYRSRLAQAQLKASDFYYQRGVRLAEQGNLDAALVEYQLGLTAVPEHPKLLNAMNDALARKEAETLYQEARGALEAGKGPEARRSLERAVETWPGHKAAGELLAQLRARDGEQAAERLALTSRAPVTLNFRQTDLKAAFEFLARSFGVNVVFDEGVKSVPVTLFVKDVTFEQGLQLMLATTKTFHKVIGTNTILVAPDAKDKRAQYEDHLVRTYYLNTIRAKEMAEILKGVVAVKKLTVNDLTNSLVVRDTEDVLKIAEKVIETSDRRPAEMILDVEILEVSRTKAEQLGLDFGQSITVAYPQFTVSGSWSNAIRAGTVTLPPTTLRFFKQDVDAKILANPKVRVVNGKMAKIHIGDRVPLRSSTVVDATGQTRTTFEYKDVGVKLTVEPSIHLDNSATVKLGLEVSSLGQNVGTANEPAFSIGTRNAETSMMLRDGETAILGGLISDQDRNNRVKLPGFGDVPVVGSLFTSYDDSRDRTDVLLTITPRILRGWELPAQAARQFYSGTEAAYSMSPMFAALGPNAAVAAGSVVDAAGSAAVPAAAGEKTAATAAAADTAPSPEPEKASAIPVIEPSPPVYNVGSDQEFEVRMVGSGLQDAVGVSFDLLHNPHQLAFVSAETDPAASSAQVNGTNVPGSVRIDLGYPAGSAPAGSTSLVRVRFRAVKSGTSYLIQRGAYVTLPDGTKGTVESRAGRVVIR
jgi:general secretion pathway protein D